jgi:hypothetical protein
MLKPWVVLQLLIAKNHHLSRADRNLRSFTQVITPLSSEHPDKNGVLGESEIT